VGLALLAASAVAQVPDPYARELAQGLAGAEGALADDDFRRAAGPFSGALGPGETQRFPITLRGGHDYRFVGLCDSRCSDLDLTLYNANNDVVAQDTLPEGAPQIQVRPETSGVHTMEVRMYRCSAAPCYFALSVYSR
jgi:hypothetical protein